MAVRKQTPFAIVGVLLALYYLRRLLKKKYPIAGKTVLITGGASGIGRGCAHRFAAEGATRIIIWDINEELLRETAKELLQRHTGIVVVATKVDVGDKQCVENAKNELKCGVDIVVLNAGIVSGNNLIADIQENMVQRTFKVNVMHLFWVSQAFLPDMLRRNEGHVVVVASMAGLIGSSRMADYSSSKWAAVGFAENLRVELKEQKSKIRTTCIMPMFIDTGMFEGVSAPWLLPILRPEVVTRRIIDAVIYGDEKVGLPFWTPTVVAFARLFPTWVLDGLMSLLGADRPMGTFKTVKAQGRTS